MTARRPIPTGKIFARACIALTNAGVLAPQHPHANNLLEAIARAKGQSKPEQRYLLAEAIRIIEAWVTEQEGAKPKEPEAWNSWKSRPEWKPDLAMQQALQRCAESRPRVSPLRGIV